MSFDENKTLAELAIESLSTSDDFDNKEIEPACKYLLEQLEIDFSLLSENEKVLLMSNFVHLMCMVIKDIKLINKRLCKYQNEYRKYEKDRSNAAEYYRRKIEYFCSVNKEARTEIFDFLQDRLKEYLLENTFNSLKREQENDKFSAFFMGRRYNVAQFPEYYDLDFNFSTIVKVNNLPGVALIDMMNVEKEYLSLYKSDKAQYTQKLYKIVDDKNVIDDVLARIQNTYHLHKRYEIFQDLKNLFLEKHYQSFVSLGLLQLEGLFYDLCQIKYGSNENMGTLVEKVQKSLQGKNEVSFMRYYPYFAFDIPIQRNEIAHKGMLETVDLEGAAYNLILDLNSVAIMVKSESYDKFIVFVMTYHNIREVESKNIEDTNLEQNIYKSFISELIANSFIANEHFWAVLKNPTAFAEEMDFYKDDNLQDGYVGLREIVETLSTMIRHELFWKELLSIVAESTSSNGELPSELRNFANRMKNDYIAELTNATKLSCIEISKLLK